MLHQHGKPVDPRGRAEHRQTIQAHPEIASERRVLGVSRMNSVQARPRPKPEGHFQGAAVKLSPATPSRGAVLADGEKNSNINDHGCDPWPVWPVQASPPARLR